VSDLADAHVLAAEHLLSLKGIEVFNLGTGVGTSVLELTDAVNRATNGRLQVEHTARRPGDPATLFAAADKAQRVLGWRPTRSSIDTIVRTALAWQRCRSAPR
jgi:UDP-arabinose 4-epimerase